MSAPEPAKPDICYFHWRERVVVRSSYGLIRMSCPDCDYFQIIEACRQCYESVERANKNNGNRRCYGCGQRSLASLCRVPIGLV